MSSTKLSSPPKGYTKKEWDGFKSSFKLPDTFTGFEYEKTTVKSPYSRLMVNGLKIGDTSLSIDVWSKYLGVSKDTLVNRSNNGKNLQNGLAVDAEMSITDKILEYTKRKGYLIVSEVMLDMGLSVDQVYGTTKNLFNNHKAILKTSSGNLKIYYPKGAKLSNQKISEIVSTDKRIKASMRRVTVTTPESAIKAGRTSISRCTEKWLYTPFWSDAL